MTLFEKSIVVGPIPEVIEPVLTEKLFYRNDNIRKGLR